MNKILKKIVIVFITALALAFSNLCMAQEAPSLFQPVTAPPESKITLVGNLPRGDWKVLLANVIKLVLAITGSLAFAAFTYGGVMMVTAQGNDQQISKGKNILFYSVLALAIIAASYAIVLGITQLQFFQ